MKRFVLTIAALLAPLFPFPALAQPGLPVCNSAVMVSCSVGSTAGLRLLKPQALPTSATVVTIYDVRLEMLLVATGANAISLTVTDAAGNFVLNGVAVAANTTYVIPLYDAWCPGGFSVSGTATGATIQGRFKQ